MEYEEVSAAALEWAQDKAVCDGNLLTDWLSGECLGEEAFQIDIGRYASAALAAEKLRRDYSAAETMRSVDLLALAFGFTAHEKARIAAIDELRNRYLRDLRERGVLL